MEPAFHDTHPNRLAAALSFASMPNGKHGDHWRTDLFNWNLSAFGEPIDSLLREIHQLGGDRLLDEEPWQSKLWHLWPAWGRSEEKDAELVLLADGLTAVRDRLRKEAVDRGWEVE